eukprot:1116374-Pyramimonas_sp.AAC.1
MADLSFSYFDGDWTDKLVNDAGGGDEADDASEAKRGPGRLFRPRLKKPLSAPRRRAAVPPTYQSRIFSLSEESRARPRRFWTVTT